MGLNLERLYPALRRGYALLFTRFRLRLPPIHTFFELTYRCNLRCRFCQFLKLLEQKSPQALLETEVSLEEMRDIIDQVPAHTLITLSGGEPLLRQDFREIVSYACRRHKVHIITNGTLMDQDVTGWLMGLGMGSPFSNGLFWISFSLQGDRETHDRLTGVNGSYDRTVEGITKVIKGRLSRYPCVNIQTVVNSLNVASLSHVVELADDLGVGLCNFIAENLGNHFDREAETRSCNMNSVPLMPRIERQILMENLDRADLRSRKSRVRIRYPMGGREDLVDYYSGILNLSDFLCYEPWTTMVVCADGEVRSCFGHSFGNLKRQGLLEIWRGEKLELFRSRLSRAGTFPGCVGCCMLQPRFKDNLW